MSLVLLSPVAFVMSCQQALIPDTVCTCRRRVSYTQERHQFHVYVNDGITFLCVAEEVGGDVQPAC